MLCYIVLFQQQLFLKQRLYVFCIDVCKYATESDHSLSLSADFATFDTVT